MSYDCPKCGYYPPDEEFYYYTGDLDEDGEPEYINCASHVDGDLGRLEPKPPEGFKAYPVISNSHQVFSMDCSNAFEWDETHWCPHCKEEFIISNGNC